MNGKKISFAVLESSNQITFDFPYNQVQRGTLQLRVHPRHGRDAILSVEKGQFLCSFDGCRVQVRFDDAEAVAFSASEPDSHDTTLLFIQGYDRFTKRLKAAKKVRIEAQFFQEGPRTFEFDVEGLQWPPKG